MSNMDTPDKDTAAGRAQPVPARITAALNLRQLYGPEVDLACGAREPDVDRWEDPDDELLPTPEQVVLLAKLTGFPVGYFYQPMTVHVGPMVVRYRGRRPCEWVEPEEPRRKGPTQLHLFPGGAIPQ